jgi:hypothetical protein
MRSIIVAVNRSGDITEKFGNNQRENNTDRAGNPA